jgi:DNA polymerase-1
MAFDCQACALRKNCGHPVVGMGKFSNLGPAAVDLTCVGGLAVIGLSPNMGAARSGYPMAMPGMGSEAETLGRLLSESGLQPEEVFRTYLLKCPQTEVLDPKSRKAKPTPADIKISVNACHTHLEAELSAVQPKVIIALGAQVSKRITGGSIEAGMYEGVDSSKAVRIQALGGSESIPNRSGFFRAFSCPGLEEAAENQASYGQALSVFKAARALLHPESQGSDSPGLLTSGDDGGKVENIIHYAYTSDEIIAAFEAIYAKSDTESYMQFDFETSGLVWYKRRFFPHVAKILCLGISFGEHEAWAILLRPQMRTPLILEWLQKVLEHPISKCAHNGKFDMHMAMADPQIFPVNFNFDTMLASHICAQEARHHSLDTYQYMRPDLGAYKNLPDKYCPDKDERGYESCPDPILLEYCAKDVLLTATVRKYFEAKKIELGMGPLFHELVMPHSAIATMAEFTGVSFDTDGAMELGSQYLKESEMLETKILEALGRSPESSMPLFAGSTSGAPLNLRSDKQLGELLYGPISKGGLGFKPPAMTESNKPSTDAESLETLIREHPEIGPVLKDLLQMRELEKKMGYFGYGRRDDGSEGVTQPKHEDKRVGLLHCVDIDGFLHTDYRIHGTTTGRLSSVRPNLQNPPNDKALRGTIRARPGHVFIDSDYSQLELRIITIESKEDALMAVFREGRDPHTETACRAFGMKPEDFQGVSYKGKTYPSEALVLDEYPDANKKEIKNNSKRSERTLAKNINFGVICYGGGPQVLMSAVPGTKRDVAEASIEEAKRGYPKLNAWIEATHATTRKTGCVRYSMGRIRRFHGMNKGDETLVAMALRQDVNHKIQGTGADCLTESMIRIARSLVEAGLSFQARILLEIHDAVIVECREEVRDEVAAIIRTSMTAPKSFLADTVPLEISMKFVNNLGDEL